MPSLIEFDDRCLCILRQSLLAARPEEGCAILLGKHFEYGNHSDSSSPLLNGASSCPCIRVKFIWPVCNVWIPGIHGLNEVDGKDGSSLQSMPRSRRTRFAIDPLEQLHAQRWARQKSWQILGSAHSHPDGESSLSEVDCRWALPPTLMVVVAGSGRIAAWWIESGHDGDRPRLTCLGEWS